MKILVYLFVVLSTFVGFVSCGGDEDESAGGSSKNPLIGTWIENNSTEWYEWTFDSKTVECITCDYKGYRYEWCEGDNKFKYSWDSETQTGSFSFRYVEKGGYPQTTTYTFEYLNGVLYCEEKEENYSTYRFKMTKK